MGNDPKTSLLNKWNQMHHCKNVFVTDGSCMTSTATQNPSLTFMAISARSANHAIKLLKTKEIQLAKSELYKQLKLFSNFSKGF